MLPNNALPPGRRSPRPTTIAPPVSKDVYQAVGSRPRRSSTLSSIDSEAPCRATFATVAVVPVCTHRIIATLHAAPGRRRSVIENVLSEAGNMLMASGKSPSDLFKPCSATSSLMKSIMTDVDPEEDEKDEDEDEGDRRSTIDDSSGWSWGRDGTSCNAEERQGGWETAGCDGAVAVDDACRAVGGEEVVGAATSFSMGARERKAALFNIGPRSSNTSRSASASMVGAVPFDVDGVMTSEVLGTRIVASTSSGDSEGWVSEEMDAENKGKEAEDTKLRKAAMGAQRLRQGVEMVIFKS
ncbi:hypothetical protein BU15DRAFT_61967 [Melanogaster broomeanus]|nr:hypothetical protein BU15DRAFT_61967 [Melanogaster broomeanus]